MFMVWLILNLFLLAEDLVLAEDTSSEATLSLTRLHNFSPYPVEMSSTVYQSFQETLFNKKTTNMTLGYQFPKGIAWLTSIIPTRQEGNIDDCFECSYDEPHLSIKCNKTPVARECDAYAKCSSGPGILWSYCDAHNEYLSSVHLRNETTTCLGRSLVFYFVTTPVNETVVPTSSLSTTENIAMTSSSGTSFVQSTSKTPPVPSISWSSSLFSTPVSSLASSNNLTSFSLSNASQSPLSDKSPLPINPQPNNNESSPFSVSLIASSVAASVGTFLILLILFVILRKRRHASRKRNESMERTNTVVSQTTLNSISYENASNVHQQTSRANETTASTHERAESVIYTEIARSTNSQSNSGNHFNADKDYIHAVDVNNYFLATGLPRSISQFVENACIWGAETSERVHTTEYSSKPDHDNGRKLNANNDHVNTNACKIDNCVANGNEINCIEQKESGNFDNNTQRYTDEGNKNKRSRKENSSAGMNNNENVKSRTSPELFSIRKNICDNQMVTAVALQAKCEFSVQEGSDGVRKYNPLDVSNVEVHQYLPLAHKQLNRNDCRNVVDDGKYLSSGTSVNYVDLKDDLASSNTVSDCLSSLGLVDGMLKLCQ